MEKHIILKEEILRQYKSVRAFSKEMDIPYSTLATALSGNIDGMAYGTVLKICEKLEISPVDLTPIYSKGAYNKALGEGKLLKQYQLLNRTGKKRAIEYLEDMAQLSKYTEQ